MPTAPFPCYLVNKDPQGRVTGEVVHKTLDDLPPGEALIQVACSSLNYKDALSATGHPGVTRRFPHVPGIDAAGTVVESSSTSVVPGDEVIVTGHDMGQNTWGGFAGHIRVPAEWVLPKPAGLSLKECMIYGTAGLTAGLALDALMAAGLNPKSGEIVVTGASGGVGCLAVGLLAKAGFTVAAVTGKPGAHELLRRLGAARILDRKEVHDESEKPLLAPTWAGAVDTVGGRTLATLVRSLKRGGCVAACGLVGGVDLPLTVYPFILRGAKLVGIDSAECDRARRVHIWEQLAGAWKLPDLSGVASTIDLKGLPGRIADILAGQVMGRVVVVPQ